MTAKTYQTDNKLVITTLAVFLIANLIFNGLHYVLNSPGPTATVLSHYLYQPGDSARDEEGHWLRFQQPNTEWQRMSFSIKVEKETPFIWKKIILPQNIGQGKSLFLRNMHQFFEVYQGGKEIYRFGDLSGVSKTKFTGFPWHLIPLESNAPLFFRIYSHSHLIGVDGIPVIDTTNNLLKRLFIGDILRQLLAVVMVFAGIAGLVFYFSCGYSRILWFSLFSIAMGVNTFSWASSILFFLPFSEVFELAKILSLDLSLIALCVFVNDIIFKGKNRWIPLVVTALIIYSVMTGLLSLLGFNSVVNPLTMLSFPDLLTLFFLTCLVYQVAYGAQADISDLRQDARILLIGLGVMLLYVAKDALARHNLNEWSPHSTHFGAVLMMFCCLYVIVMRHLRKMAELKTAVEARDHLIISSSQELKIPLNGIMSTSQKLLDKNPNLSRPIKNSVDSVIVNVRKMFGQVNDIVDSVKLKNNQITLNKKAVDIRHAVEIVLNFYSFTTDFKKLVLSNKIPEDLPAAHADYFRLVQILHNLISNAIKFTDEGVIMATAEQKFDHIEICIEDTGAGMTPDKVERLFDLTNYQQKSGSGNNLSGLGMYITRRLVELHDGRIWVDSTPNKGSRFYFTVPFTTREAEEFDDQLVLNNLYTEETQKMNLTSSADNPNILIVDTDRQNISRLIKQLAGSFNVIQAATGAECLMLIEKNKPDLILLEMSLPDGPGIDVCKTIRKRYSKVEMPVIFQTIKDSYFLMNEAFSAGGNDYIIKPFTKVELIARIENHLNLNEEQEKIPEVVYKIIKLLDDIVYIKSARNYCDLYSYDNKYRMRSLRVTLNDICKYLHTFVRINKSCIVNLSHIKSINHRGKNYYVDFNESFKEKVEFKISKIYLENIKNKIQVIE